MPWMPLPYSKSQNVDLIFLDINLPKLSGISFLKNLSAPPKVIITTAYPEYALEGFELDVTDYLLKPFSFERFHKAVMKLNEQKMEKASPDFVFIKSDKEFFKVELKDVLYFRADDNYVKIVTPEKNPPASGLAPKLGRAIIQ